MAAAIEVAYAVFTRTWLRERLDGLDLELAVTALRLATVAAYWLLFKGLIRGRAPDVAALRHPMVLAGIGLALAVPFLFQGWSPGGGLGTALVFASTSVVVGVREELLYRGVLLNLLEPRIGAAGALLLSTALFVIYHYGALPFTALPLIECTSLSLLLGLIYLRSGSLLAVIALHSAYDAAWFFGPVAGPLPDAWRPAFLLPALALVFLGTWRRLPP